MTAYKLSKKEIARFNADLTDAEAIMDDLDRAKKAGVPNIEELELACQTCVDRIKALKEQYAKDAK